MSCQETEDIRKFVASWERMSYIVYPGQGDYLGEFWVTDREVDDGWNWWILFEYADGHFHDLGHHEWWGRWHQY